MTLIRGRGRGIEVDFGERVLDEALVELRERLNARPGFYRGSSATAAFGGAVPTSANLAELRGILGEGGVALSGVSGPPELEALAALEGLAWAATASGPPDLARRRAMRPRAEVKLSDSARSLVADFAGARADIAQRRKRGEASVPRLDPRAPEPPPQAAPALHVVEAPPGTLYHAGTLRGGQALHHLGNIVVVGDVNPGAELVATGDIVVFGRLSGVAHAGAQGDEAARVYALQLAATQLRIATFIAADEGGRSGASPAEVAIVRDGRIVIAPIDKLDRLNASVGGQ